MKTTDLATTPLPRVTFVLSRDRAIYDFPLAGIVQHPENDRHDSQTVEWFLGQLDNHYPLIIYTFKQTLVNLCGQLVERGALKPSDVQVLIVEGDDVHVSTYDERGCLLDWRYGWFMHDEEIVRAYLTKHNLSPF